MSLACLAHVNFLLYIYFDVITEQINDDDDDENCSDMGLTYSNRGKSTCSWQKQADEELL